MKIPAEIVATSEVCGTALATLVKLGEIFTQKVRESIAVWTIEHICIHTVNVYSIYLSIHIYIKYKFKYISNTNSNMNIILYHLSYCAVEI